VLAGATAWRKIQQSGLKADDIEVMVGASGGPKWFCLYGLDQYLLGQFFAGRSKPLHLLGSSAGAWRFSCYAQQDAVAASARFAKAYSEICYPAGADVSLVTRISHTVIDQVLPTAQHCAEVLTNPVMKLHLIVDRARGLTKVSNSLLQGAALGLTATANLLHRSLLQFFYQRVHFYAPGACAPFMHSAELPTEHVALTSDNLRAAILASGSIPMVLEPIENICDAKPGRYFDGGITDYHFNQRFSEDGLVLYPHFYPNLTPGWFDKALPWRRVKPELLHNVIILCPSDSWVRSLPYGKIPDSKDYKLPDAQRIAYWQEVLQRSHELASAFASGNYQLELL
jgi:hypothetical protein